MSGALTSPPIDVKMSNINDTNLVMEPRGAEITTKAKFQPKLRGKN